MRNVNSFLIGIAASEAIRLARRAASPRNLGYVKPDNQQAATETPSPRSISQNDFLRDFYKECGREVTLAYTTLNQMKNWAIVVTAALLAAFASFARLGPETTPLQSTWLVALAASTLSLMFNVRFFIRAALCYVNLLRWNRLQKAIVTLLLPTSTSKDDNEKNLEIEINTYYHDWCSPITRWQQITSNLKLGFGLLLITPLLVLTVCTAVLLGDPIGMAIATFAFSGVLVEAYEFATTPFLDSPDAKKRRSASSFPGHSGRVSTILLWLLAFTLSALVYTSLSHAEGNPVRVE